MSNAAMEKVIKIRTGKERLKFSCLFELTLIAVLAPMGAFVLQKQYGDKLVLFGNIEVVDIENLPPDRFRKLVKKAISEGKFVDEIVPVEIPHA